VYSNKWYQSLWSEKPRKSHAHIVMGEPVNISEVTRVVCDMEHWTRAWRTSSRDHIELCDVKSWVRCVTGEIVRFSPTSVIDGGKHNI
jgi:hypothetical protein